MLYRLWNTFWQSDNDFFSELTFSKFVIFRIFPKMRFHEKVGCTVLGHQKSSIRRAAGSNTNFKHISGGPRTRFSKRNSEIQKSWDRDFRKNEYVGLPLYWLCGRCAIYAERAVNCQPSFCPGNSPSRYQWNLMLLWKETVKNGKQVVRHSK